MSFRVFLTGGTGYVGSAVLDALVRGGHQVTAIARDPEKVAGIESRGAKGLLAELGTPARYMDIALESDVVVHAALEHSPRGAQLDGDLLDRLLPALSDTGSAKTFIYTSGILAHRAGAGPRGRVGSGRAHAARGLACPARATRARRRRRSACARRSSGQGSSMVAGGGSCPTC